MQFRQRNSILSTLGGIFSKSLIVEGGILLFAAVLRLWGLDIKPPHFDEGINGWFVDQMRSSGFYQYDPENYHGPIYFYALFVSLSLLGRNIWALRLPAVFSSIASVWVALRFDRYFGTTAARFGAMALAVSAAAVFYGRYAIHESSMVLGLMILTWGLLGLWKFGERRDLIAAFTGIALILLIKETAIIHLGCFGVAVGVLLLWQRWVPSRPSLPPFATHRWSDRDLAWCCVLSMLSLIFFYSGTFLNWPGVMDFFRAYAKWFHTGTGDGGHVKAEYQVGPLNYYWLALMVRYEWPALLGLAYAVRMAWPSTAMVRYLAIYAVGVLVAYSIVPYKTPWCILSILWPFALLFGCAVQEVLQGLRSRYSEKKALTVVGIASLLILGGSLLLALRLNFIHETDPAEPYVYVQTLPEIRILTDPVLGLAAQDPRNHAMGGQIVLESYYPLPWIFGDFTRIGYYGKEELPSELNGDFVVALTAQQKVVEQRLKEPYLRRRFHLRDSMDECTVWFREAVFKNWFSDPLHGAVDRIDHTERVPPVKP